MSVTSATGSRASKPVKKAANPAKSRPTGGTFVGLDIGTQMIKVVEVRGYKNNLTVTAMGSAMTPPGTIQAGIVSDPKTLGNAIKALLNRTGVRSRRAVSSVAGADGVVVRVIEVAPMTRPELKEMMRYEVERHIPFPAADIQMDFEIVDPEQAANPNPENPSMEVLLAVARNDMLNAHLNTLQVAGVTPAAIDVEPLAVGRALLDLSKSGLGGKNVVIVNIGAAITDVGVYKQGVLRFPRTVPIAGENFTRAISDYLGIALEQAEEEKRQHATILMDMLNQQADVFTNATEPSPFDFDFGDTPSTPAPDAGSATAQQSGRFDPYGASTATATETTATASPATATPSLNGGQELAPDDPRNRRRREIFDALLPILQEFATEIRRSIDYFRSRYPMETVDQIVLCGGSAKIVNLDRYVEYELGISTIVGDPLANVQVIAKNRDTEMSPAYAVALGLAARDAIIGL